MNTLFPNVAPRQQRTVTLCGITWILWSALVLFLPSSILWRDSGEFVLTATYLDIAHPAGFSLYAMLANVLTLFPFGPPAFRVHLFSALVGVVILGLSVRLFLAGKDKAAGAWIASVLLVTPIFLKQLFSAEVYTLHAAIILLLLCLYQEFLRRNDLRLIVLCAFIAGVGLANHIALGATLLWFIALFVAEGKETVRRVFFPAVTAGLVGMSLYLYQPVRALNPLSLSTGEPATLSRFIAHVSDARDRLARPVTAPPNEIGSTGQSFSLLRGLGADYARLASLWGVVPFLLATTGVAILFRRTIKLGLAIIGTIVTNLLFFAGWDFDPWIITLVLLAVAAVRAIVTIAGWFPQWRWLTPFMGGLIVSSSLWNNLDSLRAGLTLRNWHAPRTYGHELLKRLAPSSTFLPEASYFILKYLRDAEGYRPDVALLYQPGLLFPHYFRPVRITREPQRFFSSDSDASSNDPLPQFQALVPDFCFEASALLSARLAATVYLQANGLSCSHDNAASRYDEQYLNSARKELAALRHEARSGNRFVFEESTFFLQAKLLGITELLRQTGLFGEAIMLIKESCYPITTTHCSSQVLNNLAVLLIDRGTPAEAARIILDLIQTGADQSALHQNLSLAVAALGESAISVASNDYERGLIQSLRGKNP